MASASGVRAGRAFVEIGADPRKLFAALNRLERDFRKIGKSATQLGMKMTAIGTGLAAPLALAVRQFASFDDAIRATSAVSGVTGADLQMLNDAARELGRTTSFTAVQVANLMTELGRAGFSPDEINAMTGAVLNLARASGTDAALAAEIMSASLRQFSLGASEATRVADVLTKTANSTFSSVEGLGESLEYAGPVALSLGMSLEDTVAILGTLGNVGIQGSEAGTALRRLSVIAAGSGEEIQKIFGISNTDAAGNLKPLVDVLDEINQVTANMPVADRTAKMAQAFGLLGITSANVLSQTAGGVRQLADELQGAGGVAAKTASMMDAGLGGAFRIALSAIEGTALAIADSLEPSITSLAKIVTGVAGGLTTFIKENKELVANIAGGIAAFLAVGVAVTSFGISMQVAAFSIGGVNVALKSIVAPVRLITVTLAGLLASTFKATAGIVTYAATSIAAAATTAAAWAVANAPLIALAAGVAGIGAAVVYASGGFSTLGQTITAALGRIPGLAGQAGTAIGDSFNTVLSDAKVVFSDLHTTATSTWSGISDALAVGDFAGAAEIGWLGVQVVFQRSIQAIMSYVDPFVEYLQNGFGTVFTFVANVVDSGITNVAAGFSTGFAIIQGIIDNVVNGIMATFDNLVASIQIAWIRVQGLITGAKDTEQRVQAIRDKNAARAEQRRQQRPGIEGRVRESNAANRQRFADLDERMQGRITENEQAQADRAARTQQRAEQRQQNIDDLQGRMDSTRQRLAANREAIDLLPQISQAQTLDDLRALSEQIAALETAGASADVIARLNDALDEQALDLDKRRADQQRADEAAKKVQQDPGPSRGEVAGTFSAAAVGGLGIGSTVMDRIANATEATARHTQKIGNEGVSE